MWFVIGGLGLVLLLTLAFHVWAMIRISKLREKRLMLLRMDYSLYQHIGHSYDKITLWNITYNPSWEDIVNTAKKRRKYHELLKS